MAELANGLTPESVAIRVEESQPGVMSIPLGRTPLKIESFKFNQSGEQSGVAGLIAKPPSNDPNVYARAPVVDPTALCPPDSHAAKTASRRRQASKTGSIIFCSRPWKR